MQMNSQSYFCGFTIDNVNEMYRYQKGEAKKIIRNWRRTLSVEAPDRTIRIFPIKKIRDLRYDEGYEIYAYDVFEKYGKVESTNSRYRIDADPELDELKYVLVQFEDAKVADDLIKEGRVIIIDTEFEVVPLKRIPEDSTCTNESITKQMESITLQQVNIEQSILFRVPTEESSGNIMNVLNDDCLRKVFEKVHSYSAFAQMANVCRRFNVIAKEVLHLKIRQTTVYLENLSFEKKTILSRIEKFLRVFGSSVLSLQLNEYRFIKSDIPDVSNTLLKMIYKYCKNLRDLGLRITDVSDETLVEIQPILSKLKCLRIYRINSNLGRFKDFVSACTQLETLHIYGWNINEIILPVIKLANLINFSIRVPRISIDEFLLANPQIEKLDGILAPHLCRLIANKMPNIRKLTLRCDDVLFSDTDSKYLRQLEHLKVEISTDLRNSITNIFRMNNITKLRISVYDFFDETLFLELTKNLCNLNELLIFFEKHHKVSTFFLKKMLNNAKQLTLLGLYITRDCLHYFDETDYYDILEIVKSRADRKKLIIEIKCETYLFRTAEGFAGHKTKLIRLNMDPKLLTVSVKYAHSHYQNYF